MSQFRYEKDDAGIVTVTMDMNGPVNTMNEAFAGLLRDTVERLEGESGLTGVIFASGKKTFFAGGDLKWLVSIQPGQEEEFFNGVEASKAVMRRIEKLGVPSVAAINGSALGGGLELALCCHRRIAWDDRSVKLGFPEVTLGLLPGGGGTVRAPYLLGIQASLPYLTEGKQVSPKQAASDGIIHETVDSLDELHPRAKAWLQEVKGNSDAAVQPWDKKGYKIPGGGSNSPRIAPLIAAGSAMLFQKTRGRMPAPAMILDTVVEAGRISFDNALRVESRNFTKIVMTPQAKNMITALFFQLNQVNGGASRPKDIAPSKVNKVGILGAGMMGQGIAYVSAMAGISVVLKDVSLDGAERGKGYSDKLLSKRVAKGRMSVADKQAVLDRIKPTAHLGDLEGCDLIVEAVFERIDIKDQVLKESESMLAHGGVWGSNTSTLPITRLAKNSTRPENFIGLHFFSPVDKMPLLEIVVGDKTSDETVARAFDYARQIKKTPIVVSDGVGFYTSRTIGTHINEAVQLVVEGVEAARVEGLGRGLAYPVGPLTLLDEVSLALTADILETQLKMGLLQPEDNPTPDATAFVQRMVTEFDRPGRKGGRGFYDYSESGKKLWSGLAQFQKPNANIPDRDIEDRLMFRPIIESLVCLESGVLRTVADGNIGSIMGIGAPPWTGGYIQFVNTYGADRFVQRCTELAERYGDRFKAPKIAVESAQAKKTFI